MKTTIFNRKAQAFFAAAAVLAAVFTAGCKTESDGDSGPGYVKVDFGTNGDGLKEYLKTKASSVEVNYIEITGLAKEDLKGTTSPSTASRLGKILIDNDAIDVALKFGEIPDLTDMSRCFYECKNLVKAPEIPESVTDLDFCFCGCERLIRAPSVIPKNVRTMYGCFSECKKLMQAPVISEGVTDMKTCFSKCESLTKVPAIPDSVKQMAVCFSGCKKLAEVPAVPKNVEFLRQCFYQCGSLKAVTLKCDYNPATILGNQAFAAAFYGCTSLTAGSIKVPSGQLAAYKAAAATMSAQAEWFAAE
ncbi:leucine-rich repeat protein [Treponema socranskii]|uniref:leucine-rich repeat protein n=1 Tax=Treponema socranskii TaxID=53419 RepID=UPI003D925A34